MANPFTPQLYPSMRLSELSALVDTHYRWTNDIDLSSPSAQAHFWYVSEEKLEPRMGNRYDEDGAEREMPFNIPAYVADLRRALKSADDSLTVAEFLIIILNCAILSGVCRQQPVIPTVRLGIIWLMGTAGLLIF